MLLHSVQLNAGILIRRFSYKRIIDCVQSIFVDCGYATMMELASLRVYARQLKIIVINWWPINRSCFRSWRLNIWVSFKIVFLGDLFLHCYEILLVVSILLEPSSNFLCNLLLYFPLALLCDFLFKLISTEKITNHHFQNLMKFALFLRIMSSRKINSFVISRS